MAQKAVHLVFVQAMVDGIEWSAMAGLAMVEACQTIDLRL